MRIVYSLLALIVLTLSVAACNTVNGVGKDLSSAGHAISGAAD